MKGSPEEWPRKEENGACGCMHQLAAQLLLQNSLLYKHIKELGPHPGSQGSSHDAGNVREGWRRAGKDREVYSWAANMPPFLLALTGAEVLPECCLFGVLGMCIGAACMAALALNMHAVSAFQRPLMPSCALRKLLAHTEPRGGRLGSTHGARLLYQSDPSVVQ